MTDFKLDPDFQILVVDDSDTMRAIIIGTLKKIGVTRFQEAFGGKKALEILGKDDGKINLIIPPDSSYPKYHLSPIETRQSFKDKKWKTIVGFQTRNVPHVGHEYVQKTALTFVDGLFINPVI